MRQDSVSFPPCQISFAKEAALLDGPLALHLPIAVATGGRCVRVLRLALSICSTGCVLNSLDWGSLGSTGTRKLSLTVFRCLECLLGERIVPVQVGFEDSKGAFPGHYHAGQVLDQRRG